MSHQLSVFNFNNSQVRVQLLNNEPLFCLTDVIKILHIKNANASRFNMSEAGIHKMYIRSGGQNREVTFINEPNLYRVIFRSNKKEAVEFQNWVFDEVLPTIRKTGSYSLTINSEQQQAIKQAVNERSYRTGEHYQAIYTKLYEQFKIPRYQDLPASKFDEAIKWLGGVHSRSGLSDEDWYDLAWLYKAAERMRYQIELIEPALRMIDSGFRGNFYSMAREYKRVLYSAKVIIERETAHIQPKNIIDKWNNVLPIIRHC
ncbi:ORF6C domain-containing protein [Gilliamella sp. B2969]|uniref:BRO family protein n=1 Tax=Gilliamella sp. B2969 TaxID=2818021 RepID=UPI002269F11F|nr:BRO family protein [Gilliamella sp. B2969]MCX8729639.1 ORF6C domain-containing protein [Gilliamella sp. B2969]